MILIKRIIPLSAKDYTSILLSLLTVCVFPSCTSYTNTTTTDSNSASSAANEFIQADWDYTTAVYDDYIRSVLLYQGEDQLAPPYIPLEGLQLTCRFDDLNGGFNDYNYAIVHCDYHWTPSDMEDYEYVQGFNDNSITEMDESFNRKQMYTHYTFSFPNDMMRITRSGNYLLKVYPDGQEDNPIFTHRFVVYENLIGYNVNVKPSTIVSERRYKQEVDFELEQISYPIYDAYADLDVVILQNDRWDNAIFDLKPVFMKGTTFVYDFDEENNFNGLNEFRWFDSKSIRFTALGTDSIRMVNNQWHLYLHPSARRTYEVYRTDIDINGKRLLKNDDFDPFLESEYMFVHFYLPYEFRYPASSIYIYGALTNWNYQDRAKMDWNPDKKRYEGQLYLKQGYYNYMYSVVSPENPDGDLTAIEGNNQATENTYSIFTYYNDPQGYSRVIGLYVTDSYNK